jgi:hypothetical protein
MEKTFLYLSNDDYSGSRVGGRAPDLEYKDGYLDSHSFLLTLSHKEIYTIDELSVSIFIRNGYRVTDKDTRFPDIGIDCVMHPPVAKRSDDLGRMSVLNESVLSEGVEKAIDPDFYFIKIGGNPNLIQKERYYENEVIEAGYSFLFEVNEEGYPADALNGDYPFNYGALYVYGKFNDEGRVIGVVAGFTQYS